MIKKGFIILLGLTIIACGIKKEKKRYPIGRIKTQQGEMLIWLYDKTPNHKGSFIELATAGYWDSLTFNRVVPNFVIQGGCPDTPSGFKDPLYLLAPELDSSLTHTYGAVGAGRDDNPEKYSARCQFYIIQNKEGAHRLDSSYTVFGYVFKGMDVVDAIATVARDSTNKPIQPVSLDVDVLFLNKEQLYELGFIARKTSKTQ